MSQMAGLVFSWMCPVHQSLMKLSKTTQLHTKQHIVGTEFDFMFYVEVHAFGHTYFLKDVDDFNPIGKSRNKFPCT